ncbi:MAG: ribonuclease [Planctomycetaceae bacterium]|nr:ribonuclease [Planctomycetaceae bacterium]
MGAYLHRFRTAFQQFVDHDCLSYGAAIAYYTIFSLPPLLVIILALTGMLGFTKADVDHLMYGELGLPQTEIQTELPENMQIKPVAADGAYFGIGDLGAGSQFVGVLLFLFSATAIFGQLQSALNKIWQVAPDPQQGGLRGFLFKRLLTAGMVAVIWFVLLVSLTLTAVIGQILTAIKGAAPDFIEQLLALAVNEFATFAVAVLLFAAIFKILPDAQLQWRDVWVGAIITAALFIIGKMGIGWYLRTCQVGSSWGASAASTAAALVWVYYSSLIVLFGAELSQVWATQYGNYIKPVEGAVHLKRNQQTP